MPNYVDCAFGDDSIGDRQRNRYLALSAMEMLGDKYDWMWRLAPDSQLTENVTYDPFAAMAASGKTYGYLSTMTDDSRCVAGLWDAVRAYVSVKDLSPTFFSVLPENVVFYNGFEISHRSLWQSEQYRDFFDYLDRKGGMFYHRWNEANIHTLALSLFARPEELHRFSDVGFEHWPFVKQVSSRAVNKKKLVHSLRGREMAVSAAPELDRLFAPRRLGFLGSDVATSFRLPSSAKGHGDYLWLFGDTFLGTSDGVRRDSASAVVVHNSIAFAPAAAGGKDLRPGDVHFFWQLDDEGHPTEIFKAPEGEEDVMLWPVSGLSVEYQGTGKLVLMAQRVVKKHDLMELLVGEGMNFEVEGTSVIIVDNPQAPPSRWAYRVAHLPDTDKSNNWCVRLPAILTHLSASRLD